MELVNPGLFLIAIGGLLLITQCSRPVVLAALLVQWFGLIYQTIEPGLGTSIAMSEGITAVACCGILFLTLRGLDRSGNKAESSAQPSGSAIADHLWLWAVALVAGVAGYGLARLYPIGGNEQDLLAFYWMALPAMLALVIDGARDPVKLGASLLSLVNAGLLLVYALGTTSPTVALLALASLSRLALAAILGYTWLFLKTSYRSIDLNIPFDLRDSKVAGQTALTIIAQPGWEQAAQEDSTNDETAEAANVPVIEESTHDPGQVDGDV